MLFFFKNRIVLILILFNLSLNLFCNDQHKEKEITKLISANKLDSAMVLSKRWMISAKKNKNDIQISKGYRFLFRSSKTFQNQRKYIDSGLVFTKNVLPKEHIMFYVHKASIFTRQKQFDKTVEYSLKAIQLAEEIEYYLVIYGIKYNLALLKKKVGDFQESKQLLKENLNYFDRLKKTNKQEKYLLKITYDLLSSLYIHERKIDSATKYHHLSKRLHEEKNLHIPSEINNAYILYYNNELEESEKTINHVIKEITTTKYKLFSNKLISCYYLLSMIKMDLKSDDMIYYFNKIDSISNVDKTYNFESRKNLEHFLDYAKTKNDTDLQLTILNKLVKMDSILHVNHYDISKNLLHKYDSDQLFIEKDNVINQKNTLGLLTIVLSIIGVISIITVVLIYFKSKEKDRKYLKLIELNKSNTEEKQILKPKTNPKVKNEVVQKILSKLDRFEQNNEFINQTSLIKLSKSFGTNPSYLSRVINQNKEKNFSQYLSDLRIEYLVQQLLEDKKMRDFKINYLANQVGFKSMESFIKAFERNTGLKPNFFIKKLNKDNNL